MDTGAIAAVADPEATPEPDEATAAGTSDNVVSAGEGGVTIIAPRQRCRTRRTLSGRSHILRAQHSSTSLRMRSRRSSSSTGASTRRGSRAVATATTVEARLLSAVGYKYDAPPGTINDEALPPPPPPPSVCDDDGDTPAATAATAATGDDGSGGAAVAAAAAAPPVLLPPPTAYDHVTVTAALTTGTNSNTSVYSAYDGAAVQPYVVPQQYAQ